MKRSEGLGTLKSGSRRPKATTAGTRLSARVGKPKSIEGIGLDLTNAGSLARLQLLAIADSIAALSKEFPHLETGAEPVVQKRGRKGDSALRWLARRLGHGTDDRPNAALDVVPGLVEWNSSLDTIWAHKNSRMDGLVHVFHQEWHGIRAAAGYMPGNKLALSSARRISHENLRKIVEVVANSKPEAIVFHGWSTNCVLVAHALREGLGSATKLIAVWHGNTAQFVNPFEIEVVGQLLRLRKKGLLDAIAGVKPGLQILDNSFFPIPLLNFPPRVSGAKIAVPVSNSILVPMPIDWRKNYYTNVLAAAASGADRVYLTSELQEGFPISMAAEIVYVPRPTRRDLFALFPTMGIVMNASLSECQPMVALESLAFGVPCITGRLNLGELDNHEYQKLCQIDAVDSLDCLAQAATRLLERRRKSRPELDEMARDYQSRLIKAAYVRYSEVLS